MPFNNSYQDDLTKLHQDHLNAQRTASYAQSATPDLANRVVDISSNHPWVPPKTTYALAATGNDSKSPLTQAVSTAAINKHGGGFWGKLGDVVGTATRTSIRGALAAVESPFQALSGTWRDIASAGGAVGRVAAGAIAGAGTGAAIGGLGGGTLGSIIPGLGNIVGAIGGVAGGAIYGGIAGGIAGAAAPDVSGHYVNPFDQTTLGQVFNEWKSGDGVQIGGGFMPGGQVREDQVKRAREAANINGMGLTGGRLLASSILHPGSTPFNIASGLVDAALVTKYDPAIWAGEEVKGVREARKLIVPTEEVTAARSPLSRAAGLLKANAPVVDVEKAANDFLTHPDVQQWAQATARDTSAASIRAKSLNKLPASVAKELEGANTAQDVLDVAKNAILKEGVNEKRAFDTGASNWMASTWQSFRNSRFAANVPRGAIDLVDMDKPENSFKLDRATDKFRDWLKNTSMDAETQEKHLNDFMGVKSSAEAQQVLDRAIGVDFRNHLMNLWDDKSVVDKALGNFKDVHNDLRQTIQNEIGTDTELPGVMLGGEATPIARAAPVSEYLDHVIEMPNSRDVRRLTTPNAALRTIYNSSAWQTSVGGLDKFMTRLWRPLNLIRGAWTARMVGEESVRMAAAGMDPPAFHPLSLVSMLISPETRYSRAIGVTGDIHALSEAHDASMVKLNSLSQDAGIWSKHSQIYRAGDEGAGQAFAGNLLRLHNDDLSRYIAENGADAARDWWWSGDGSALRERYSVDAGRPLTQAESDRQVFQQHDWIKQITAENPQLIHSIKTGYIPLEGQEAGASKRMLTGAHADIESRVHDIASQVADQEAERAVRLASRRKAAATVQAVEEQATEKVEDPILKAALREGRKAAKGKAEEIFPGVAGGTATKLSEADKTGIERMAAVLNAHNADPEEIAQLPEEAWGMVQQLAGHEGELTTDLKRRVIREVKNTPKALTEEQLAAKEEVWQEAYNAASRKAREDIYKGLGTTPESAQTPLPTFIESGERQRIPLRRSDGMGFVHPDASKYLDDLLENPEVRTPEEIRGAREVDDSYKGKMGKGVQRLFTLAMGIPTNQMIRSPAFNGAYWDRIHELVPFMSDEAKSATLELLDKGTTQEAKQVASRMDEINHAMRVETDPYVKNILADEYTQLEEKMAAGGVVKVSDAKKSAIQAAAQGSTGGELSLEEADGLAKSHGLSEVQKRFVDLGDRKAWEEATRHIAPFAHAWRQAMVKWSRILYEDPMVIRKAQRVMAGGGMESGLDTSMSLDFLKQEAQARGVELPDDVDKLPSDEAKQEVLDQINAAGENGGFFYKNDNGEWVFNYPGSELLTRMATGEGLNPIHRFQTGIPAPLQAKASGISMMSTSILPGAGPIVSILASKILPDKPQWDGIRNFLAPYGDPTQKGILGAVLPPWMMKFKQAWDSPASDRLQANTVMDVAKYLVSTGEYNTRTPEAQNELLDAAKERARNLTMLRGAAQFFVPSAPSPVPMAQDKDGRTVVAQLLIQDLQRMQRADYDNATKNFLDKYGDQALLYLQSNTRPVKGNLPDTDKALDFARQNPDLVRKFPNVYGFFAPPNGKFSYAAYLRTLNTGEREQLTPDEQIKLANDRVGSMIYYNLKDSLGGKANDAQRSVLAQIKAGLMEQLPGFNRADVGLEQRADNAQMVDEIQKAVQDPKVAASPVGQAVSGYLQVRDMVAKLAEERGIKSWQTSNSMAGARNVLRQIGDQLAQRVPGFNLVYDRVFDQEMTNDTLQEASA